MTKQDQIRLLKIFAGVCGTRKVAPIMVESWIDMGLVEEVEGSIDPDRSMLGQSYRLYALTPKGREFIG